MKVILDFEFHIIDVGGHWEKYIVKGPNGSSWSQNVLLILTIISGAPIYQSTSTSLH